MLSMDKWMKCCESWAPFVARLLVGGMFLVMGVFKFMDPGSLAGFLTSVAPWMPMPVAMIYLAGALEVLGGLMVITGFWFRYGVLALAGFTFVVTAIFHTNFADPMQMTMAFKNGCVFAALLYMLTYGAGGMAMGGKQMPTGTV